MRHPTITITTKSKKKKKSQRSRKDDQTRTQGRSFHDERRGTKWREMKEERGNKDEPVYPMYVM